MPAKLLSGKEIAQEIRQNIQKEVEALLATGIVPGLTVIVVGEDPASQIYVASKERSAKELGMRSQLIRMPADVDQAALLEKIDELNQDARVHGILIQLPLPAHLDEHLVMERIKPEKDVDGFHAMNAGRLFSGMESLVPCTPKGAMEMIRRARSDLSGLHAVVVGRSNIVGKPMAMLLLQNDCTVTICHSRTKDLGAITRTADILVVAVGRKEAIRGDMIKPGAIVVDVGINRIPGSKKIYGDVAFEEAEAVAGWITPVPGGVGVMTITMLLDNTIKAAKMQMKA